MKRLPAKAFAYTLALYAMFGLVATSAGQSDVQEIDVPPPAVKGSTEPKKMPDEWKLQRSTDTQPTPKFKEVPPPETKSDKRKYSDQTDDAVKKGWKKHSKEHFTPD